MTALAGFRAEVRDWLAGHVPDPPLPGTGPMSRSGAGRRLG